MTKAPARVARRDASVKPISICGLRPHQLLARREDASPSRPPALIAGFEHGVNTHGGFDWGVGAVALCQVAGGTPDVEVGDNSIQARARANPNSVIEACLISRAPRVISTQPSRSRFIHATNTLSFGIT